MYGMLCSILGIALNIVLFGIKCLAGVLTGSVAITADAFNNLSDAGSSLITLVGFKFAGMKPDKEHPFGHGRFEYISGLIVAMTIILMGFELMRSSVEKIVHPSAVEVNTAAMIILGLSVVVKLYMAFYNFIIGKKIHSSAMRATAMDSLSDTVSTSVVMIAMLFTIIAKVNVDGYCGALVAIFILWAGIQAARETVSPLLGTKPAPEMIEKITEIVLAHDKVAGIHDLIVHDYGPGRVMISLHVEVPGDENIFWLHDMIDVIEAELDEALHCESVIHMDPIDCNNENVTRMRKEVSDIVQEIDTVLTIHDFRMVTGSTHTNLIFDVVVPQEFFVSDSQLTEEIRKRVSEKYENHFCVIKVDKTYV